MHGKFYAVALVAAFSIVAAWTPEAGAQYYRPARTSSYYPATAYYPATSYYPATAYYAPSGYGYSGYGYSGYARPSYDYSGYGSSYSYGNSRVYTPRFGRYRGYYGGY